MKKFNFILVFITSLLFTVITKAQSDNLEPVNGIFSIYDYQFDYYSLVRKILFNKLSDNPEIRVLMLPSFSPERVLDIEESGTDNKFYLVFHKAEQSIWYANESKWYSNESISYSNEKSKIKIDSAKKEISSTSVAAVKKLFKKAILQAKFLEDSTVRLDGTTYYFSVEDLGQKTAKTWCPDAKSKTGRLVNIASRLIEFVNSNSAKVEFDPAFSQEIENLISELE
jgi:hypothetical protein